MGSCAPSRARYAVANQCGAGGPSTSTWLQSFCCSDSGDAKLTQTPGEMMLCAASDFHSGNGSKAPRFIPSRQSRCCQYSDCRWLLTREPVAATSAMSFEDERAD